MKSRELANWQNENNNDMIDTADLYARLVDQDFKFIAVPKGDSD
jgi:hypothetical protein